MWTMDRIIHEAIGAIRATGFPDQGDRLNRRWAGLDEWRTLQTVLQDDETIERIAMGLDNRHKTEVLLVATSQRVLRVSRTGSVGILGTADQVVSVPYDRIVHVASSQGIWGGTVVVREEGGAGVELQGCPKPAILPLVSHIERRTSEARSKAAPVSSSPSLASELRALAELHAAGGLTDEEYQAAKRLVLKP